MYFWNWLVINLVGRLARLPNQLRKIKNLLNFQDPFVINRNQIGRKTSICPWNEMAMFVFTAGHSKDHRCYFLHTTLWALVERKPSPTTLSYCKSAGTEGIWPWPASPELCQMVCHLRQQTLVYCFVYAGLCIITSHKFMGFSLIIILPVGIISLCFVDKILNSA